MLPFGKPPEKLVVIRLGCSKDMDKPSNIHLGEVLMQALHCSEIIKCQPGKNSDVIINRWAVFHQHSRFTSLGSGNNFIPLAKERANNLHWQSFFPNGFDQKVCPIQARPSSCVSVHMHMYIHKGRISLEAFCLRQKQSDIGDSQGWTKCALIWSNKAVFIFLDRLG